jgi:glycosyltransferase involved in cell wall biosynthesis
MRMKVAHVAPTEFGDDGLFGGGERYPQELAAELARHVDCRLITFGSANRTTVDESGLEKVVLRRVMKLRGHIAHPVAAGLLAATQDADIVHVHQMRSVPARTMALVCAIRRQPVVVTDHGLGGGGWAGFLPRLFDAFLPVSRHSAETLGAPEHKTSVVYGGVDANRFRPRRLRRRGLLFVGRITPHKGIDRLIEALPHDLPLKIVGTTGHDPGPLGRKYAALLRRLAHGKRVEFAGRIPDALLPETYCTAEALVLPSVHETCYGARVEISELLGLSAIEAMASATPVICSRVGGLPEVVPDGESGLVVDPGDVPGLRAAIEAVTGDPERAAEMGRRARRRALDHFTWDACAQRCLAVYRSLLEGGAE